MQVTIDPTREDHLIVLEKNTYPFIEGKTIKMDKTIVKKT